jgi:Zn-dependent protease with chaperone function
MAQAPQLDFAAFVARKKNERSTGSAEGSGHEYAYVSDRDTRAAFERVKPIELAVASTVRMWKQMGRNQLLGTGVKVSDRQFPRIQRLVQQCADSLDIPTPQVYIVNSPVLNAATYGTNEDSFIQIHSALIDHYSDEELLTVIGHECGHVHNQHVVYLTALYYLTHFVGAFIQWAVQPAIIALRAWQRRAEITCDRAGMLCAKDDAVLALLVLLEERLEQYEEGKDGIGKYMEAFATHPYLPKRVLAMRVFAESALYRKAAGLTAEKEGLTMKEVDDRVRALLKGDA